MRGRQRMRRCAEEPWLQTVGSNDSSTGQKAIGGAEILARGLGTSYQMVEEPSENLRSATAYLPKDESSDGESSLPVRDWQPIDENGG
jgi:hypothetical protein